MAPIADRTSPSLSKWVGERPECDQKVKTFVEKHGNKYPLLHAKDAKERALAKAGPGTEGSLCRTVGKLRGKGLCDEESI